MISIDLMKIKDDFPNVKKIILLACDSDFVPLIKEIQNKGVKVILYTYFDKIRHSKFSTSNHLLDVASRWEKLSKEDFD